MLKVIHSIANNAIAGYETGLNSLVATTPKKSGFFVSGYYFLGG